jgi:hypothetical protein
MWGHPSKDNRIRDMLEAAEEWMPTSSPNGKGAAEDKLEEDELQDTPGICSNTADKNKS